MSKLLKPALALLLLSVLALTACFAQTKVDHKPFMFDTGISGIELQNAKSTIGVIGKNSWLHRFEKNDDFSFIRIECLNSDGSELLRLGFFEGGYKNEVEVFQMLRKPANYKLGSRTIKTKIPYFISKLKIKLGMSEADVRKTIGGTCKVEEKSRLKKLTWHTDDPKTAILTHYQGIGYSIICNFDNNKLTEYYLGFDYP